MGHPLNFIKITGEPGSKPFPGFVAHQDQSGAKLNLASDNTVVRQLVQQSDHNNSDDTQQPVKSQKISPVKRTRFRSKDKKKIVLKRRKVKRLRTLPPKTRDKLKDDFAVGLAPEAHRGGSLAELALATLSEEELSSEHNRQR